jgi:5'-AMP-activated protein kinase regulatory beta subunit
MGNSSSQEEDARKGHKSSGSKDLRHSKEAVQNDQIPVVPHGFDRSLPIGTKKTPTTSVSKESATVSPPGGREIQPLIVQPEPAVESSAEPELYTHEHVETVETPPADMAPLRRKSTILLDEPAELEEEEMEMRKLTLSNDVKPLSRAGSGEEVELSHRSEYDGRKYDTVIEWKQGGQKVYVTGSFTGWRKMIKLHQKDNGEFSVMLKLPKGTHRMRFVVDSEMRCSDFLPTATDSMGNLVNYLEVGETSETITPPEEAVDDEAKYERFEDDEVVHEPILMYGNEIPSVFTDPEVMDRFVSSDFVTPPQLPPHLEGVILNSNSTEKDNNSVLPIPNHVVLNHLATTSIKHNVLAVASISRYSRKYVTQILYAPL